MKTFILTTYSVLFAAIVLVVWLRSDHAGADAPESMPAKEQMTDEPSTKELDPELSLTHSEIRNRYDWGLKLGAGVSEAWHWFHVNGLYNVNPDLSYVLAVGGGEWRFQSKDSQKNYEIMTFARSINVGPRYYFTEITALYLQASVGYVFWTGSIKPRGTSTDPTPEQEEILSRFRSGFRATGSVLSTKLGWASHWENGFFLDICLVGMAHSWMIEQTFTRSTSEAKAAVEGKLQAPMLWGLMNLSVGVLF